MDKEKYNKIEKRLENCEKRLSKLETIIQTKPVMENINVGQSKELARRINVDEEKLNQLIGKIYLIKEGILTMIEPPGKLGRTDKERTKKIVLLTIWGYKHLLKKEDISTQEVKRNVEENRVPTNNFATHIDEMSSEIRRKGKVRSPKTAYLITSFGESNAWELIKQLIEQ